MKTIIVVLLILLSTSIYSQNYSQIEKYEKHIEKTFEVDIINRESHQEEFVTRFEQMEEQVKALSDAEYWLVDTLVQLSNGISEKIYFGWDDNSEMTSITEQFLSDSLWQNRNRTSKFYDSVGVSQIILYENWDDSVWVNDKRYEQYKEPNDSGLIELQYIWQDSLWENYKKLSLFRYEDMRILIEAEHIYISGIWANYRQRIAQFNDDNQPVMVMLQEGSINGWNNIKRELFDYDDDGRPVSRLVQFWENSSWCDMFRISYAYNVVEKTDTLVLSQFLDSSFVPSQRLIVTSDNMNRETQELFQSMENGKWRNVQSRSVIYYQDTKYPSAQITEYWLDSVNTDLVRVLYDYNTNGHLTGTREEEYLAPDWNLQYQSGITYSDGHIQVENFAWSGDTSIPADGDLIIYGPRLSYNNQRGYQTDIYYHTYTPVDVNDNNNVPTEYNLSQNYPNPFNPITKISFTLPVKAYASLKIYDILGREVEVLVSGELSEGTHIYTFDASRLASGVYLYRLKSGEFTMTKKMMLLK